MQQTYLQTNAKWLMPVLFGAGKTQRVQLDFSPRTTGNYIVEVGVDPLKALSAGKFLVFKLNGVMVGTHRSYESINDDNNEFTPMLVHVRISLGRLLAGTNCRLEISSDAGSDRILATYFYLYKSGFKTECLANKHLHGKTAEHNQLSRTLGYNYVSYSNSGHGSVADRSTVADAELSDEMMLLECAGEADNAFGTNHMSMAFINQTASNTGWYIRKEDDTEAAALSLDGLGIYNHPDPDRL